MHIVFAGGFQGSLAHMRGRLCGSSLDLAGIYKRNKNKQNKS